MPLMVTIQPWVFTTCWSRQLSSPSNSWKMNFLLFKKNIRRWNLNPGPPPQFQNIHSLETTRLWLRYSSEAYQGWINSTCQNSVDGLAPLVPYINNFVIRVNNPPVISFFLIFSLLRSTSFWPPSLVYISVIIYTLHFFMTDLNRQLFQLFVC